MQSYFSIERSRKENVKEARENIKNIWRVGDNKEKPWTNTAK